MPARRSFRMDKLIVSGLPLFWRREGAKNALVPLSGVLLRRHIPRECLAAFGQRNLRTRLPKSLRLATWSGIVFIDSQCLVGRVQPCRRLLARLPCRQLRSAQDPARARPWSGNPAHVAELRSLFRAVSRRALN